MGNQMEVQPMAGWEQPMQPAHDQQDCVRLLFISRGDKHFTGWCWLIALGNREDPPSRLTRVVEPR